MLKCSAVCASMYKFFGHLVCLPRPHIHLLALALLAAFPQLASHAANWLPSSLADGINQGTHWLMPLCSVGLLTSCLAAKAHGMVQVPLWGSSLHRLPGAADGDCIRGCHLWRGVHCHPRCKQHQDFLGCISVVADMFAMLLPRIFKPS